VTRVLVFDCGTTALKATVFETDGRVVGSVDTTYPPAPAPHLRDPNDWWHAAVTAAWQLPRDGVEAIALTGAMENYIPVAADGTPTADAVMYSDPVGAEPLAELSEALIAVDAQRLVGNAPEPLMSGFKLKALGTSGARWILPGSKDYLALRMTGTAATDPSCASTTGLMDIVARDWSPEMIDLLAIDGSVLPPLVAATEPVGRLTEAAASALGLAAGIVVINGCGDGAATTIGSGATQPGEVSIYLGTSGWIAGVTETTDREPRPYYRLAHPLGPGLIEIAPILSAGAAADWARSVLGLSLERAEELAEVHDLSPANVLFLPYLDGERSPFLDLELRGGFLSVGARDDAGALYYAALEGVAFAIAANITAMGTGGDVFLVGGGAKSLIWPQLIADIVGRPVSIPEHPVLAASLGALATATTHLRLPLPGQALARRYQPRHERKKRTARQAARFAEATRAAQALARI